MDWILTNVITWGNAIYAAVIWFVSSVLWIADYFLEDRFPRASKAAVFLISVGIFAIPFPINKAEFLIPTIIGYGIGVLTYLMVSRFKLFPFEIIKNIASRNWED